MAPRHCDDDRVLHSGLLFKRGSGSNFPFGRTNWKTRYVVLTPSTLKYFKYEGGPWKGEVNLISGDKDKPHLPAHRTTIEVMPADSKKTGKSASTIWRIAVNTKRRRLLLAASSEIEMNLWVAKLSLALRIGHSENSHDQHLTLARLSYHHQQPRRSLPDAIAAGSSTVMTEFQGSAQALSRQRQSIGATSEDSAADGTIWSQHPPENIWELRETSATKSSGDLFMVSPQEPGEFDYSRLSAQSDVDIFCARDTAIAAATPLSRRRKQARELSDPHQCLPSAPKAFRFTDSFLESEQRSPPSTIADFQNFARSRRRRSIDAGERSVASVSIPHERRRYSANPFKHEPRHRRVLKEFDNADNEAENADEAEMKVAGNTCKKRRWRFTCFRRWLLRRE